MRAKVTIESVTRYGGSEELRMRAVSSDRYDKDGANEDNTFARFTPDGEIRLQISNPDLIGKFNPNDRFYVDFTKAE